MTKIDVSFHLEEQNDGYNQWNVALSHIPVRTAYIRNHSPVFKINRSRTNAIKIRDADDIPLELPLVLVSPYNSSEFPGEINLFEFKHPEECVYFFGSNRMDMNKQQLGNRKPNYSIWIPTSEDYTMYAWTAMTLTLYHRNYWK